MSLRGIVAPVLIVALVLVALIAGGAPIRGTAVAGWPVQTPWQQLGPATTEQPAAAAGALQP